MASVVGLDLGGTKLAAARFNSSSWQEQAAERIDTNADRGFESVFEDMIHLIEKMKTNDTVSVGIGVPGLVTQPDGKLLKLPNIPNAENFALKHQLEHRLEVPVFVENDANCFTLAEAILGAGRNHKVIVGITMGTGVGGGIVVDEIIFHGHQGFAGEIGHMLLKPGSPPFETNDKRGDIEQFLSGTALGKRCTDTKDPKEYLEGQKCSNLWPDLHREIAWMCVSLTHLLDPSVIVFGGAAGRSLKSHMKNIEQECHQWILPDTPLPELKIAELTNPHTLGAALLTR